MMDTVQETLQAYTTQAAEINHQKAIVEADIHKKIDQLHQVLDQRRVDLVIALASSTEQKLNELATQGILSRKRTRRSVDVWSMLQDVSSQEKVLKC